MATSTAPPAAQLPTRPPVQQGAVREDRTYDESVKTTSGLSVSVIIPTYNESENVERVIDRCRTALAGHPFEIVIVDDDSPDGTWRVVSTVYAGDSRIRVIRRTEERGLATAVSHGIRAATYDCCVILDADLQHPPEKIPALLAALESGADIAIASRYTAGGGIENWSPYRRFVSRGALVIAKLLIPQVRSVTDPMSGFFAFRRELVSGVTLAPIGYKILLELLVRCEYTLVVDVPYVFHQREHGESKLSLREYLDFLEHAFQLARWARRYPRPHLT
ncbi:MULTISPECIES: polyprenol monophosphomannose synthase [unclassified Haladaptatus]|uniref:polyprenol monophosphomannose synthase n=1 Tax=unclassified Haladaptatus TaxID=2622732 RepID=UPI0023E8326C|nr:MULTISPECIES: polyprenol monophosphomannose synthase [unclassified Haladaptatus]